MSVAAHQQFQEERRKLHSRRQLLPESEPGTVSCHTCSPDCMQTRMLSIMGYLNEASAVQ